MKNRLALSFTCDFPRYLIATKQDCIQTDWQSHMQMTRKRHEGLYRNAMYKEHAKIIWKCYCDDIDTDEVPDTWRSFFQRVKRTRASSERGNLVEQSMKKLRN